MDRHQVAARSGAGAGAILPAHQDHGLRRPSARPRRCAPTPPTTRCMPTRDGTIAYFHGNFIPKRDPAFDFTRPVDGSNPATEWQGPHALEDTITLLNPSNGWIQNTNNWPFSAAGAAEPEARELSGLHVDQGRESARHSRRGGAAEYPRRDLGQLDRRRLRRASDRLRRAAAAAVRRLRSVGRRRSAARRACKEPIADFARLESAHRGRLRADRRRHFLGPGDCSSARAPRRAMPTNRSTTTWSAI